MKKQKPRTPKFKLNWCLAGLVVAGLLLIGLVSAQVFYDQEVWRRVRILEDRNLSDMIIDGIKGIGKPATVEGSSGKVYLTEPRLVLPPYPTEVQDIRYSYDQTDGRVQLTTDISLGIGTMRVRMANGLEDIFKQVPKAQACAAQVTLTFKDIYPQENDKLSQAGTKQLANNKTLYMYVNRDCTENSEPLIKYLQQIQSY